MSEWYSNDKEELKQIIKNYLVGEKKVKTIRGIIVPHAGYAYSGKVAGQAFSHLQKSKIEKAIVFGPSHYVGFRGIATLEKMKTPFGEMKITKNNLPKLKYEHSVENQIPFLQYLGVKEVLPIVVGEITIEEAEEIAKKFAKENAFFVFSTDLSHFLPYTQAVAKDKRTMGIIKNLELGKIDEMDACGVYPLLVAMQLCKIKKWKPKLIEYKNSGDITGDKSSVVGYASFIF